MVKEILGLIIARGGSKGIPGKNIKDLAGKPLIAYTIEAALQSEYIDRVVVSTDDEEIARVSREYGAEIPFMRPAEYARDDTSSVDTVLHALKWLKNNEKYKPDLFLLLQPTSPLRDESDIDNSIKKLLEHKEADSLKSVCKAEESPYWMKKIDEQGYLKPFIEKESEIYRRQDLPDIYVSNGAIYLIQYDAFLNNKSFKTDKTIPFIMDNKKSVDIDLDYDWLIAECLIKRR